MADPNLHWADVTIIVLYLFASFGVGLWTILSTKGGDIKNFFLAGRSLAWWPIGMSLFASNIGSVNFVGIAGSGAASGTAVVMFEWNAVWLLMLLGWVFLPVYVASGIYTMPEYLQRRFGGDRLRIYLSIIQMITYIFATLSVDLYSGAVFIQQTLGWDLYVGVIFLLIITVIFTAFGGLTTVIFTDALAVVIMVCGGLLLSIIGFVQIGGMTSLAYKYMRAVPNTTLANPNTTCGYPRDDALHIFRDAWEADYPWLGTNLRTTIGALWYWCANQVLVQRALAAKNITHAKGATIFASYLKLTPMFIMVLTGMISRALYPDEVACTEPEICQAVCENEVGCSNIALPKLVVELLPIGLRGLMIAAMIAAVISTLTSIFNSSSTLFTLDIWARIRPKASERELLFVGRIFLVLLTGVSIMWIPMISDAQGGEIFRYSTTVTGYLGAPTCAMFILAMFWYRCNEPGAFWGMLISQAWGLVRFVLDFVYPLPGCDEEDTRPGIVKDFHAYYHTFSQVLLAFLAAAIISLLTKPGPPKEKLGGLTFWTRYVKPWKDVLYEKYLADMTAVQKVGGDNEYKSGDRATKDEYATISNDNKTDFSSEVDSYVGNYMECRERSSIAISEGNGIITANEEIKTIPHLEGDNKEPAEDHASRMVYLTETPFWKKVCNINAVLVMTVTVFLYGFFY